MVNYQIIIFLQLSISFNILKLSSVICRHVCATLQKTEVYAWWKFPTKRFKIYHILCIWKPQKIFPYLISCCSIFSLMNALVYVDIHQGIHKGKKIKVARNEKWNKQLWVFVYIKYGKFWSISLELFIKQKHLFSEEWCWCLK